jgi:hypothetical protein
MPPRRLGVQAKAYERVFVGEKGAKALVFSSVEHVNDL